ncbi:MAG: YbaK/EbsC family protein [Gammaproteobacteria bacterium]|nr:YbaK/EbsC family protein [Gammaproteobacteria bacterium]NND61018.1 YbaK/EbsC family protein [Gammaproteobacteria bacterium]
MNKETTGAARFQALLARRGLAQRMRRLPDSTRTAAEAAAAIGCEEANIAKSIVFRCGDGAVVVVASGVNRVDTDKVARLLGDRVGRADAEFVRVHTGYAIGGVPPFGHPEPLPTLIDDDLFHLGEIWAAAGGPYEVFRTSADELVEIGDARRADVRVDP